MHITRKLFVVVMLAVISIQTNCHAAEEVTSSSTDNDHSRAEVQVMKSFPLRVFDSEHQPVSNAQVRPWALQSGQGHGRWEKSYRTESQPETTITDARGQTTVAYPYFEDVVEGVRTIGVSIYVDHPDHAFLNSIHIDVPLETDTPYEVVLEKGIPVTLHPTIDGEPIGTDDLYAYWSEGRCWLDGYMLRREGTVLRLPPVEAGSQSVLIAKMEGDRISHFSKIVDFEVSAEQHCIVDVPLTAVEPIQGMLSDNVPRPVINGRISLSTLNPAEAASNRVMWNTWVSVRQDGTFTIDAWPIGEKIQLTCLSDGYIAATGEPPAECEDMSLEQSQRYLRPQVFATDELLSIKVIMIPLVQCKVTVADEDDHAVAGVNLVVGPNVQWWNGGSQIYCDSLMSGERRLKYRNYESSLDHGYLTPFQATTDRLGNATMELPAGRQRIGIFSEVYELPINLGSRDVRAELKAGEKKEIRVEVQPNGTEKLGDWDKLAGVVFGCSTREGRRIRELAGVRGKMNNFATLFRDAKAHQDPILLTRAYATVADAFAGIDDYAEASKWYKKAAEQQQAIEDTEH